MSYDFDLSIDTGAGNRAYAYNASPTFNLSGMFAAAFEGGISATLKGKSAAEAAPLIRAALDKMLADPPAFKALNPPNGWGTYEGAIQFLQEFAQACAEHPLCTVNAT